MELTTPDRSTRTVRPGRTAQQEGLQTTLGIEPPGPMITARPPEHTKVCWAGALGAAERLVGGYIDHADPTAEAAIVAGARELLATDASHCICPKPTAGPASSKQGRRYR